MPGLKLTYFNFDGGRGEPIRIALHAASMDFEDHRISFDEFMKTRAAMPFTCAPVLTIDGVDVTQSNAMLRFVGKKAGLYPQDDLQALSDCSGSVTARLVGEWFRPETPSTGGPGAGSIEAIRRLHFDGGPGDH